MVAEKEKPVLSKREREVLEAVARGSSNQEIADELVISVNTVRVHLRNIFEKIQVQSRTEATMWAIQQGLIAPELVQPVQDEDAEPATRTALTEPALAIPRLARWQRIYLWAALLIAAVIVAVPAIKPLLNQPRADLFPTDSTQANPSPLEAPADNRWVTVGHLPLPTAYLTLVPYQGELYAIGGSGPVGVVAEVDVYHPETDGWRKMALKPTAVANIQGAVIDDLIYVAGGCVNAEGVTAQLEIFDPVADRWQVAAPLPEPRCAYAATAYNGELYLIGGWNGEQYVNSVFVYNPASDTWRMLAQPYPLKIGFAAAAVLDGQLYVAGGYDGRREYADVNIFDVETGEWAAGPSLKQPRGGLGLVAVSDGLYAVGGGWAHLLTANEHLTGEREEWEAIKTPYFGEWRNFGLAALDTRLYAVGGWSDEYLDTVVEYPTEIKIFLPVFQ